MRGSGFFGLGLGVFLLSSMSLSYVSLHVESASLVTWFCIGINFVKLGFWVRKTFVYRSFVWLYLSFDKHSLLVLKST